MRIIENVFYFRNNNLLTTANRIRYHSIEGKKTKQKGKIAIVIINLEEIEQNRLYWPKLLISYIESRKKHINLPPG